LAVFVGLVLEVALPEQVENPGIDEILNGGLQPWLTEFIPLVRELGIASHSSYMEVI